MSGIDSTGLDRFSFFNANLSRVVKKDEPITRQNLNNKNSSEVRTALFSIQFGLSIGSELELQFKCETFAKQR